MGLLVVPITGPMYVQGCHRIVEHVVTGSYRVGRRHTPSGRSTRCTRCSCPGRCADCEILRVMLPRLLRSSCPITSISTDAACWSGKFIDVALTSGCQHRQLFFI